MQFGQIQMFQLMWIIAACVVFLFWAFSYKKKTVERFAARDLIPDIAATINARNQILKNIILIIVLILSVLALARPQWGFEWEKVKRKGLDIIVAVDTSKSMLTDDVKPNRLERTKLAVKDLIKKLKGDRIGLVAFSGSAFLMCPLTVDYNGFLLALEDLSVNSIPKGGTNLSSAITEAIKSYDKTPSQYKAVIIMTDGDDLEGDALAAAQEANSKGIKIFTIGIGTKEGELIRIPKEQGQLEFLKDDQGNFVKSRLNENLLQAIAQKTGGVYVRASGAQFGLDLIYDARLSKMEKRDIESKMGKKYHEKFQIPLAVAFIFLLLETWITTRKKT